MNEKFNQILAQAKAELENVSSSKELFDLKTKFLGKNGEITALLRGMKDIPPQERSAFGKQINDLKVAVEELFNVKVEKVNTILVKGHKKEQNTKSGRTVGKTSDYKKAIVTLKADSKPIAFFESLS